MVERELIQKIKVLNEAGKDIIMASKVVSKISDVETRKIYEAQLFVMMDEFNRETEAIIKELGDLLEKDKGSKVRNFQLARMHRLLNAGKKLTR